LKLTVPFGVFFGAFAVDPEPPAFNAAGEHPVNLDAAAPAFVNLVDVTELHVTWDVPAAELDAAIGTVTIALAATATTSARPRMENFIRRTPSGLHMDGHRFDRAPDPIQHQ
jgi:hypothetical protein